MAVYLHATGDPVYRADTSECTDEELDEMSKESANSSCPSAFDICDPSSFSCPPCAAAACRFSQYEGSDEEMAYQVQKNIVWKSIW